MITYKHEAFIEQAIKGVLAQVTSFPVELVIGEDNSPDRTAALIRQFADPPNFNIRARFNPTNLGAAANFEMTFSECRGQYIALLEGDDYWTDPHKLQRQVEVLDANRDFAICFHPVDVCREGRIEPDSMTRQVPAVTSILDLAEGNFIHTCSAVYRSGLIDNFPASYRTAPAGDFFLHMLHARHGKIHRLPKIMATYRVHSGGAWSSQVDVDLKILQYLEAMVGCFEPTVERILKRRHEETAFKSFARRIDEGGAEARFERCLRYGSAHMVGELSQLLRRQRERERGGILSVDIRRRIRKLLSYIQSVIRPR